MENAPHLRTTQSSLPSPQFMHIWQTKPKPRFSDQVAHDVYPSICLFSHLNKIYVKKASKDSGAAAMSTRAARSLLSWNVHSSGEGETETTCNFTEEGSKESITDYDEETLDQRKYFWFVGSMVSVTTRLTCCRMKAATDNMKRNEE